MMRNPRNIVDDHGVEVGAEYAGRGPNPMFNRIRVSSITHVAPRSVMFEVLTGSFRGSSASCMLDAFGDLYVQIDPIPQRAIDGTVDRIYRELVAPA